MQKTRLVHGRTVRQTAQEFGCSASHISRVERGDTKPSRMLVQFYEEQFEADGLLLSLFEVAEHAVGSHPLASPCFLNCELTTKLWVKYFGSSTIAVTTST